MVSTGIYGLRISVKMLCGLFYYHGHTEATLICAHMALEASSSLSVFIKSKVLWDYCAPAHVTVVCLRGLTATVAVTRRMAV